MSKNKIATIATLTTVLLMASLPFIAFSSPTDVSVNASAASAGANVAAEYGDVMQYEWPWMHGSEHWDDFSAGPAPSSPDLLWRVAVSGASSGRYYPAAFNGKVFIYGSGGWLRAVNGITGAIDWEMQYEGQSTGTPVKLDDNHMISGNVCVNPNTGALIWAADYITSPKGASVRFATSGGWGGGAGYSSTEKLFFTGGRAWDFSDPSQPPTIKWDIDGELVGGESFDAYGEGVVLVKSGTIARGLNAQTGAVIWSTQTSGGFSSYRGMYYNGMFVKGLIDDTFWAFDAQNGEVKWVFDEGIDYSNFACGSAAAYGMIYMTSGAGILYALNAENGEVVWKYESPGWASYQGHPLVADGKVYQSCPDGGRNPYTGEGAPREYVCLDAYTGKLLWKLEDIVPVGGGGEAHLIAFGNLYMIAERGYLRCYGHAESDWPMFRHDPALSGIGPSGPSVLTLRWRYRTEGQVCSSPSIVDDKLYIGSWDGNVYCLDAYSGDFIWKFQTGAVIGWSPAVVGGRVYTGCSDGYVYCLDADDGNEIWKQPVGLNMPENLTVGHDATLASSPIVVGNRLYVGSVDSKLYCLDTADGSIEWSFETAPGPKDRATTCLTSTAAVVDGVVYVTGSDGGARWSPFAPPEGNWTIFKLDADNGNLLMEKEMPYSPSFAPTTFSIFSSPLVAEDRLFIGDQNSYWYCFNATTLDEIWRYDQTQTTLILNTASYYDGKLFFTDGFFSSCVDATNGTLLWSVFLKREIYNSPTVAASGVLTDNERENVKVYTSNNDNFIHVLNLTGGKLSWYHTDSMIISSTSLYKGMAYVGCRDWYVYCFEEFSPTPPVQVKIEASVSETEIDLGDSIAVTGSIFPAIPDVPMGVSFVYVPDGSTTNVPTTAVDGTFTASFTPDTAGQWNVVPWFSGDKVRNYADSYCEEIGVKVLGEEEPTNGEEEEEEGLPMEYVYAGVAVAVIAIAAVAGYVLMKQRKK